MALTVFAIGAASVISMERASLQGNVDARKMDVANAIARDWIERLRRDAALWTQAGDTSQTAFLKDTSTYYGKWAMPVALCPNTAATPAGADGLCGAFDIFGRDLDKANYGNAMFCANIRLDGMSVDGGSPDLIRADVRVFWPRQLTQSANAPYVGASGGFCDPGGIASIDSAAGGSSTYHFVYATTMLRLNAVAQ